VAAVLRRRPHHNQSINININVEVFKIAKKNEKTDLFSSSTPLNLDPLFRDPWNFYNPLRSGNH
jgi:hypothetical protein